jgi:hypothetical protein
MSLLNDALKRASQSDRNRPRSAQPQAFLHPVGERRGHSEKRGHSLALALGAGSVLALGLAGWFFWQLWGASHSFAPAQVEPAPAVAPVIRAEIPPPPITAPQVAASTPAPALASMPETAVSAPAVPVEPAWPADLKVTGIFFRATNPLALINGKTVGVGEDIDGIRVTQIEKDRVTVEWNGKMKELKVNDGGI